MGLAAKFVIRNQFTWNSTTTMGTLAIKPAATGDFWPNCSHTAWLLFSSVSTWAVAVASSQTVGWSGPMNRPTRGFRRKLASLRDDVINFPSNVKAVALLDCLINYSLG